MLEDKVLWSGQINYQDVDNKSSYTCIVIKNGQFHNMSEEVRLDLIERLQSMAPNAKKSTVITQQHVDLEDMF